VCRPAKAFGKSFELVEDGIGGGDPHERDRVFVVPLDAAIDARGQVFNAFERTALDDLLGNKGKPALHLVQPGGKGRCEMDMKARASRKPGTHLRLPDEYRDP
jgi:hypothetical protein